MAPLDTGCVMNLRVVDPMGDRMSPSSSEFETIGAYLRAVREHRGLSLDQLSENTRVSRTLLQALEEANLSALPSRPFAIGHVRSFALALGLDGDAAAARFKLETPDYAEPLRNPVGVEHEDKRRNPLIFVLIGLVVAGVAVWNVAQRSLPLNKPKLQPVSLSPSQAAQPKLPHGPIALGAATAPPADQTTPTPYVTPGLDAAVNPGAAKTDAPSSATTGYAVPTVFVPKGAVYGAPAAASIVVLQAGKAASVIVRGAGGAVYFARQLAPGEAYRAPVGHNLTLDLADPAAFTLYIAGQSQGPLAVSPVAVDKLIPKAAPAPAPASISGPAAAKAD
jgi:cytoskeleton protein RodZ